VDMETLARFGLEAACGISPESGILVHRRQSGVYSKFQYSFTATRRRLCKTPSSWRDAISDEHPSTSHAELDMLRGSTAVQLCQCAAFSG